MADKPWFITIGSFALSGLWVLLMFGAIQIYGPRPSLLASGAGVLLFAFLFVHGQRLQYLKIGDWVVIGMDTNVSRDEPDDAEVSEWQRENR